MMNTFQKKWLLPAVTCLAMASVTNSQAAIIAGTDNGDGSWEVGGVTFSLSNDAGIFDQIDASSGFELSQGTNVRWRRDTDFIGVLSGDFTFVHYEIPGVPFGNALANSADNWLLLSLEVGETDWDTVINLSIGPSSGIADDAILSVWHDDAATGEDILQGVTAFSQIGAVSSVPEPSSLVLASLAGISVLARRRRK